MANLQLKLYGSFFFDNTNQDKAGYLDILSMVNVQHHLYVGGRLQCVCGEWKGKGGVWAGGQIIIQCMLFKT